jgi:hypothetical protein
MKGTQTKGICELCKGTFGKAAMTRHLAKCLETPKGPKGAPVREAAPNTTRLFHLVVQGKYDAQYWLHLEASATATLQDLDDFLRHIWLECCGHLSAFEIAGTRYSVPVEDDWFACEEEFDEPGTDVSLGDVLHPGRQFTHEYDFGSTTELTLKVVSERQGVAGKEPIRLLSRNEPPAIPCEGCGEPATRVSVWEGSGWFCDRCAEKRDIDEDGSLPVVNSPRVGVCGYTG